jgi:hypothetical protein
VDELSRPTNLPRGSLCYYYLVYTPYAGYQYSQANQLVLNYKIPMGGGTGLHARPDRTRYKREAIEKYAQAIVGLLMSLTLGDTDTRLVSLGKRVGLVPVPPSMAPDDQDYDNRNIKACELVCEQTGLRLCRDVETREPIGASHAGGTRDPQVIESSLERVAYGANNCDFAFLVDDVLVTGAHFMATRTCLEETGFGGQTIGLFLARSE